MLFHDHRAKTERVNYNNNNNNNKKIAKLLVYLSDDFLMKPVKPTYDMYRSNIKTV